MTTRVLVWQDAESKAKWLDAAASEDARHPMVRTLAARMRHDAAGDPEAFARLAHRHCRDAIAYRRDVGGEEFADAATVLARGFDDCDGKSRAFVALCRASGIEGLRARIVPIFDAAGHFRHVQAEATWPGARAPLAGPDGWVLAELTLAGVELGQGAEAARRDQMTGRIDLA